MLRRRCSACIGSNLNSCRIASPSLWRPVWRQASRHGGKVIGFPPFPICSSRFTRHSEPILDESEIILHHKSAYVLLRPTFFSLDLTMSWSYPLLSETISMSQTEAVFIGGQVHPPSEVLSGPILIYVPQRWFGSEPVVTGCNSVGVEDLDPKASHDVVNCLTLDSVRVTHQAGSCF